MQTIILKSTLVIPIASFPPREVLFDYIQGRVEKANVRNKIRFNTAVRNVEYSEQSGLFTLSVSNLVDDETYSEEFDYVIVASGHFSTPNVPSYEGFSHFNGRILHAHDFRDALEFEGQDILIIGSSYSAEDIGSQCWKYGAKTITVSHRTAPMGHEWPENWEEVPLLTRMQEILLILPMGAQKMLIQLFYVQAIFTISHSCQIHFA